MKRTISMLAVTGILLAATVQTSEKLFTKKGKVSFYSETALENIEAHNNRVTAVLETTTGKMEFSVLINAFEFEKALMQEHFNENYMESAKYPKSIFKGKITNWKEVNLAKDGEYVAKVEGDLTIHGVTKPVKESGTIIVKGAVVSAKSTFTVKLADYNIEHGNRIAEVIKIVVDITSLEALKK